MKYFLILFLFSCKVQVPKQKGFVLTPSGMVHKTMLTKQEEKKYKQWLKMEIEELKTN